MIENLKLITEQERKKYSNTVKEYFKQALKDIIPAEQKKQM